MIKSKPEFQKFIASPELRNSPFGAMSAEDLRFFEKELAFEDDGKISGYWGDFAKAGNLSDDEVAEFVSSTFGVEKDWFKAVYHKFGDGNGKCTSRPYYNCPYELEP